jgi:hypothetical protein
MPLSAHDPRRRLQQSLAPQFWHQRWPIIQLLSDKYGPGKYDDEMKDERCLYRRGANFKLTSGS